MSTPRCLTTRGPLMMNGTAKAATGASGWLALNQAIVGCQKCPRLLTHCQQVAAEKRAAFREWTYWGRPVPNFGDPHAEILIVGLAPAAHGANRTGRMFTGDRSGEWLYRALWKAGFANQAESVDRDDGMILRRSAITAVCHCAPPANLPTREEQAACQDWLKQTVDLLPVRVVIALGQIAWQATVDDLQRRGWLIGRRPRFGHGHEADLAGGRLLIGSYHPSQQNTFTGRLTEPMFDAIFQRAARHLNDEQESK